jgi:hypothetical protein
MPYVGSCSPHIVSNCVAENIGVVQTTALLQSENLDKCWPHFETHTLLHFYTITRQYRNIRIVLYASSSTLFYAVLHCSTLFYAVIRCSTLFYAVLRCSTLFNAVLLCSTLFYAVLRCSTLFYAVLRCSTLFYAVQCCSTPLLRTGRITALNSIIQNDLWYLIIKLRAV